MAAAVGGGSSLDVKCVAVSDPRFALAVEPDYRLVDACVQLAAQPVVREEGVQLGQQAHRRRAYRRGPASARALRAASNKTTLSPPHLGLQG
jgi:hypothetical protein